MSMQSSSEHVLSDDKRNDGQSFLPFVQEDEPQRPVRTALLKIFFQRWAKFCLRLGCTFLLLFVLLKSVPWPEFLRQLSQLDRGGLLIGVIIGFYGVVVSSYQWQYLLDAERIHMDLKRLIDLYLIGIAFNHFLPTGMGGDVVKVYYVGKERLNTSGAASSVVMSRVTGFFAMTLVSLPTLLFWHALVTRQIIMGYTFSCLAFSSLLLLAFLTVTIFPRIVPVKWLQKRVVASLLSMGTALRESVGRPRSMCQATAFGVLYHIGYILNFYVYALLLHITVPLAFYLVAIPFVSLIAILPFSINGFGLREGAFVLIFSTVHVPIPTATLLILLMDIQVLLFGLIGGGIYLISGGRKPHNVVPVPTYA